MGRAARGSDETRRDCKLDTPSQLFLGLWPWGGYWDPKLFWSLRNSQPLNIWGWGLLVLLFCFLTQSAFLSCQKTRDPNWGLVCVATIWPMRKRPPSQGQIKGDSPQTSPGGYNLCEGPAAPCSHGQLGSRPPPFPFGCLGPTCRSDSLV